MKVTTDTNVLVSATFWTGDSYKILKSINENKIELVLSEEIIEEYFDVASRREIMEKIENKKLTISEIVDSVIRNATIVEPKEKFNIVEDDLDDNKIVECAVEGKVDFIISQDSHLLKIREFRGIKTISPKDFLNILEMTK